MSTRSVVAIQQGDGWKGRYVHSDGYPTWVGRHLVNLVNRDGLETVIKRLTEDRYGWSHLNSEQPDITGVKPDVSADYGSAGLIAHNFSSRGSYSDGRFANEAGYGVAYTTKDNQSSEDEWITSEGDSWGTEWAYVLTPKGLVVLHHADGWVLVGAIPYDAPESAFQVAEDQVLCS